MRPSLFLAALALLCPAASAQIIVPAESKLGEPIVATVQGDAPEGAKVVYDWRSGAGVSFLPVDNGRSLHLWAKPGTHRLEVTVAVQVIRKIVVFVPDPEFPTDVTKAKLQTLEIAESLDVKRHEAPFMVEGAGPTPPPGPEPPGPLPEPKPGTLGALVPAEARLPLAEFYSDWASTVRSGALNSTSHFRTAHQQSATALQNSGRLPSLASVNKPISDKIAAAVGLEDVALDVAKRELLASALDSIAKEFRGQ